MAPRGAWAAERAYAVGAAAVPARRLTMARRFPILPAHPERICWGCDKYCPADSLACGNGSDRSLHPVELWGEDWNTWTPPRANGLAHVEGDAADEGGDDEVFDPSLGAPVPRGPAGGSSSGGGGGGGAAGA